VGMGSDGAVVSEDCHLVDDVVVERHLEMMGGKPPVGASACMCNVPVRIGCWASIIQSFDEP
jgi:hypothetical protein